MFFRNLIFLSFPLDLAPGLDSPEFPEALADFTLKPVGPLEHNSRGFVAPLGRDHPSLVHQVGNAIWLTVGTETRILPPAAVQERLAVRIAEAGGNKLGGKARRRLKEDLIAEMLPQAFVQPSRLNGYLDLQRGLLIIDTASRKTAESFATELRHALGSFPALPLNAEVSPRALLTGWIAGETLPEGFALGDACVLKDPVDGGAQVRCTHQELLGEEIATHLESGKQAVRLGLSYRDHVSFELDEAVVLRKVKFLDGAVDELDDTERDSLEAELSARFALMSGEVGQLFDAIEKQLQLSRPGAD